MAAKSREISHTDALLLFAAAKGEPALIEALLEEGADVRAVDELGRTPLMLVILEAARLRGRSTARFRRAVKLLLCHGADIAARDKHRHTAVELASHYRQDHLVRLLTEIRNQIVEVRSIPPRKAAQLA